VFDALVNYLTATGFPDEKYKELWPSTFTSWQGHHQVPLHYWPAMLMSAGVELPKRSSRTVFTIDGQKISKSSATP